MEIVDGKVLAISILGVVAIGNEEDVTLDVFLDHKPRAAAKAQAFALADGVEPMSAMAADALAGAHFDNVAGLVAEIAAQIVVVVDLAEEADALRVFALRVNQVLLLGDAAHLVLVHAADGEDGFLQLPVIDLRQEVRLVFHGVGAGGEPFAAVDNFGLRIVARGYEVVVATALFVECAKLDQAVAHHVGIGRKAGPHLVHRVFGDLLPIFLVAVDYFEAAAVAARHGGGHFEVLLRRAVPLLGFFRTNLNVKAIGLKPLLHKLIKHDRAVNAAGEQNRNISISKFFHCQKIVVPFNHLLRSNAVNTAINLFTNRLVAGAKPIAPRTHQI